jgi:hypothetical protein
VPKPTRKPAPPPQANKNKDWAIDGEKNVESGYFRSGKKVAILWSSKSRVAGGLAIVSGERVAESLIDTLVDQNAHLGASEQEVFCFFESGDGHFTRDGGKSLQKVFECFSAFQAVEERLERHTGSAKYRSSAENIRAFDDDSHERIVSRGIGAWAMAWVESGGFLEFEFGGERQWRVTSGEWREIEVAAPAKLSSGDEDFGGAAGSGLFADDDFDVAVERGEEIHETFDRKTIEAVVG